MSEFTTRPVMGDTPGGMWSYRKPTAEEKRVRAALEPWYKGHRDDEGKKVTLKDCVAKLHAEEA